MPVAGGFGLRPREDDTADTAEPNKTDTESLPQPTQNTETENVSSIASDADRLGYAKDHPDWATVHEKDTNGQVVYSDNEVALVEGFSVLTGQRLFAGVHKNGKRTTVDIETYDGNLFSANQKIKLSNAKQKLLEIDAANAKNKSPFGENEQVAASDGISESTKEITKQWRDLLGIKGRIFLVTADDAKDIGQAEKHAWYGPYSAIRSAGIDSNENGSARKLPNGDFYISLGRFVRKSEMLETLAHEIGHILEKEAWADADSSTKNAIVSDYKKWLEGAANANADEWVKLLRAHTTGKLTKGPKHIDALKMPPYWRSFSEWFADQVARWAQSSERPRSVVEQFFARIGAAMRRLYESAAGARYLPAKSMADWLDTRAQNNSPIQGQVSAENTDSPRFRQEEESQDPESGWRQIAPNMRVRSSPEYAAQRERLHGQLTAIVDQEAPGVNVLVEDQIEGDPGNGFVAVNGASLDRLIVVALKPGAQTAPDYFGTVNHELIHELRRMGVLSGGRWRALERQSRADWRRRFNIDRQYRGEEIRTEEGIAEAYRAWRAGGLDVRGEARSVFRTLDRLFERIRNLLTGAGFRTWQDVFSDIEQGRLRTNRAGVTSRANDRGSAAFQADRRSGVIARLTGEELGSGTLADMRDRAKAMLDRLRGSTVTNRETGIVIGFNRKSVTKATHDRGERLLKTIPAIKTMLRHGVYLGAEVARKDNDPALRRVHKFEADVDIAGDVVATVLTVREYADGRFFYALNEYAPRGGLSPRPGQTAEPNGTSIGRPRDESELSPDPDDGNSDTRFQIAPPTDSEAFKRWFGDSKVVDKNGQPLVVYHGTKADFEAFSEQARGVGISRGRGFYFSDNAEGASSYALDDMRNPDDATPQVMPVYLSLRNPLVVDAEGRPYYNVNGGNGDTGRIPNPDFDGNEDTGMRGPSGAAMFMPDPRGRVPNESINDFVKRAKEAGHDGLIVRDVGDAGNFAEARRQEKIGGTTTYVAFRPEQIKSVNNRGTFDPADPRIRFQVDALRRERGVPPEAGRVIAPAFNSRAMKRHADYTAAKGGDTQAAGRLVADLMDDKTAAAVTAQFGSDALFVAPHAEEASGRNKIPNALASYLAAITGAERDDNIAQANRVFHTGASAIDRMISRPMFDGAVQPGRRYVLVDDVTVLGGTIAELANYIQQNGGEVAGVVTLVNGSRAANIIPKFDQLRAIRERYSEILDQELGIAPESLTAAEAGYLLKYRDADSLRNRILAARQARVGSGTGPDVRPSEAEAESVERDDPALADLKAKFQVFSRDTAQQEQSSDGTRTFIRASVPRARGDQPRPDRTPSDGAARPPRTRGSTAAVVVDHPLLDPSPAHAGINRRGARSGQV